MATTKIRSSSIEDGQVANADLSATIGVTGGQIADNAVTLAKMAGGTDGNLITYDASGDPAYVLTGAATEVLTSNGVGAAPTFQAASASGFIGYTVYTAASSTWTKTDNNPTMLVVEVQGAGGSGGGGGASKGAGGGAGGYVRKFLNAATLADIDTCTVEVGAGGLNPTTNSTGNPGGASKFYKASGSGSFPSIDGLGGAGGVYSYGAGGLGGVSSGGDLNISGGSGGGNSNENNHGGGSFFTPSHYSITSGLNPSGPGTGYGGGGEGSRVTGGGAGSKGGDGMDGIVIVWEYK